MHTTVFLQESIQALNIASGKSYIDATYGEGGHTQAIIDKGGTVLAIDADTNQVAKGVKRNHTVVAGLFKDISTIASEHNLESVDGVLFDFGLSMEQLSKSGKGFSFKNILEPLDMRLGVEGQTAAELLNSLQGPELISSIMKYSEDKYATDIVRRILGHRRGKPLRTVGDLKKIIDEVVPEEEPRHKVYARIFQAVRILVNDELDQIKEGLQGALEIIKPGGVIVTITFHSLEDRLVKQFGRTHKELTMEAIDVERVRPLQSFERSAHLRVLTKK
ncbi:MAG: 16S rRNA (cytosine(1402)-N(4))-methyltransferase RsmH [bacterium]|nr:16S rRNA (cytosine(1402)-N(4))-methyltransferase RsmH [bacterium]